MTYEQQNPKIANATISIEAIQSTRLINKIQSSIPYTEYAVDSLTSGRYIMAFETFFNNPTSRQGYGSGYFVGATIFSNDGVSISQPFYMSNSNKETHSIDSNNCYSPYRSDKHTSVAAAGTADGGFVITWITTNDKIGAGKQYIYARKFVSSQDYVGKEIQVSNPYLNEQVTPYSISIRDLGTKAFAISWSTLNTPIYSPNVAVNVNIYDYDSNLLINKYAPSLEYINGNHDHITHPRIISLDGNKFSLAYHSINSHKLIANDCTYGLTKISCIQNSLFSQSLSSVERQVVQLEAYSYNNQKTPIYVYEDKDSNQCWQIYLKSYFTDSELHTLQVSMNEEGKYHNINPAVISSPDNGNIVVIWHKFFIDSDLSAGIFMQVYHANATVWYPETNKISYSEINEYFSIDNFNSPTLTSLNKGHFLVNWFDPDNGFLNSISSYREAPQELSTPNPYDNNLNNFALSLETTIIIGIVGLTAMSAVYCLKSSMFANRFNHDSTIEIQMNENSHLLSGVGATISSYIQPDTEV